MTWSYNLSLLSQGNAKDMVRLLIGDVVDCDQQMQDEEIQFIISMRGSVYGAAADCCRALAAKFSRSVDQKGGTNSVSYSQMAKAYTLKANEFDIKATFVAIPYSGGISVSDKTLQELLSDRVSPQFVKGMTDNYLPVEGGGVNEAALLSGE